MTMKISDELRISSKDVDLILVLLQRVEARYQIELDLIPFEDRKRIARLHALVHELRHHLTNPNVSS